MARGRNRSNQRWWVVALLVVLVLAALAARANAEPLDGEDDTTIDLDIVPRVVRGTQLVEVSPCPAPPFDIAALTAAAVRAAGLDDDPISSWRTRTRLAGLVPMISARVGRNLTWREVDDPTLGYTNMYDIRATWHLERLLFDQNELRISTIDVSRRRERRRVEMLAIHTYYQWLAEPAARGELGADLDAMTDGWFSHNVLKLPKP